jgi:hypothetical protein
MDVDASSTRSTTRDRSEREGKMAERVFVVGVGMIKFEKYEKAAV